MVRLNAWGMSLVVFGTLGLMIFSGCGSSTSSSSATKISGVVQLGPVDGASVTAYKLGEDGTRGDVVATTTTASDGSYKFTESNLGGYAGATEIVATGGSFLNEATGVTETRKSTDELRTIMSDLKDATLAQYSAGVPLTGLSDCTAARMKAAKQNGFDWSAAQTAATAEMKSAYGVDPYTMPYNPNSTVPNASDDRAKAMTVLAGMAKAAATTGVSAQAYMTALATDASDGKFDGKTGSTSVTLPGGASYPTTPLTSVQTGMQAWDRLPPGISSVSALPVSQITFVAAPTNKFNTQSGYYAERDQYSAKYSKYLDPRSTAYTPIYDSHNGASYNATYDPCNSAVSAYDTSKCPTSGSFNESAFKTAAASLATSMGTYDPKTGIYTNPAGTVYTPGAGGQFVNPTGGVVPPPNTSASGTAYTGASYVPGTTCGAGKYWDYVSQICKTPPTGTACTPPAWYDPGIGACKTASLNVGVRDRFGLASMQVIGYFKNLFTKWF